MKQIEVERRSVDEAIQRGLEELDLSLEEVRIDVLEEGSKGLFGLIGVKQAKVRLTVREDKDQEFDKPVMAAPQAPAAARPARMTPPAVSKADKPGANKASDAPSGETKGGQQASPGPYAQEAPRSVPREQRPFGRVVPEAPTQREVRRRRDEEEPVPLEPGEADETCAFLLKVATLMGVEVTVSPGERDGTLLLDIVGDDKGILIGHRGETLDALQYLTGLVHNKDRQNYRRVQLDSQNYRKKREETLIRLASRLADKARRSGRRVTLEPMNPYERRILHSALQGNAYVTTHSEGEEPNRRVVIVPK